MKRDAFSVLLVVLCFAGIITVSVFYNKFDSSKIPKDYAIVFDAGSSGSRMYIYQWQAGYSAAKGDPLQVTQNTSCQTEDNGLDKIRSKAELITKYSSCIKKAQQIIPDDRKSRAYLFLAATAGMRLLDVRNKTLSDEIFGYVREYFSELDFLFKNQSQARIISGQEEGTNAWISANYFEKNFDPSLDKFSQEQPVTKGVLDLGGASTQIVFVPSEQDDSYPDYFSQIRIFGITYRPYSHSFLCWGVNEISLLYQTYLINKFDYVNKPLASCFPTSSKVNLTSSQILNSACATGLVFQGKYNFTANVSRIFPGSMFEFNGKSDFTECEREVNVIVPNIKCTYKKCSFDNNYQPEIENSDFLAFSNFYYALNNTAKLFKKNEREYDLEDFQKDTSTICAMNLDALRKLNTDSGAKLQEKFLIKQCFSNVYVLTLVSRYGFENFDNFMVTDKVNGFSLNWALGYMINELNRDDFLPYEEPPRKINLSGLVVGVVLFSLIILCSSLFFMYNRYMSCKTKSTNQEIIPFGRKRNTQGDV